jgi:hypothetical protein
MYYIAYIGAAMIIIHFILYYFNIDVFNYSSKSNEKIMIIDNDITDSINELKKLNEYIDNGIYENGTGASETGASENAVCENGANENGVCETGVCENGVCI